MSKQLVQVVKTTQPLPTGVTFASTSIAVTDSTGSAQNASLNGSESPPWSVVMDLADGGGSAVVTDIDSNGNPIGSPVTATFTVSSGGGGIPGNFQASTGINVTPAS